ncbi:MAG: hypothetical protein ACLTYN_11565 [Dysosmobacter welbionis]
MKKGYLVLQDGQVFEGFRFGVRRTPWASWCSPPACAAIWRH